MSITQHEKVNMKTIGELPTNLLLGLFYFAIAYTLLASHESPVGLYLFRTFGWSNEVVSNTVALIMGAAGVYMWIGDTSGNRFKTAGFPMMAYLGLSSAAIIFNRMPLGGLEMISLLGAFLLFRDYSADARRQSLENLLNKTIADCQHETSQLRDELVKLRVKND